MAEDNIDKNYRFIINTISPWDEPPRARHQVAETLAMKHKVIFIARNKLGKKKLDIQEIGNNMTIICPYYPFDYRFRYRLPIFNEIYQIWLFKQLKKLFGDYVVINFDFTAYKIFDFFKSVIFYCNDEFLGNSKYPNVLTDAYLNFCEKRIIRRSRFCITTSAYLTQKLSKYNPATYEIPLGVNVVDQKLVYKPFRSSGQITICLMGVINDRQISIKMINELISVDTFHLILIGPIEDAFLKKLVNKDKVVITGFLKGKDLINTLSSVDVGLALYNVQRINPGATPNKLWQYLSAGIPVVINKMPNLNPQMFPIKSVYILNDGKELVNLIQTAHQENSEELFRQRIDFASENTWEKRMDKFLQILRIH